MNARGVQETDSFAELDQPSGIKSRHKRTSCSRFADRGLEVGAEQSLHDVAESARGSSGTDEVVVFMDGHKDNGRSRTRFPETCRHFEPVHAGHRYVQDDHVRAQGGGSLQRRRTVFHRPDNHAGGCQHRGDAIAHGLVVIRQKDTRVFEQ